MVAANVLNWNSLLMLLPLCQQVADQWKERDIEGLHGSAKEAAKQFGIEDLDAYLLKQLESALKGGLEPALDGDQGPLAKTLAGMAPAVGRVVMAYAKGGEDSLQFVADLNGLVSKSAGPIQNALQKSLGIPDEPAAWIQNKLGPYTVTLFCFAAAFKIFQQAANDAAVAHGHRLEAERAAAEALELIQNQRSQMEASLGTYLAERVVAFSRGVEAMDEALALGDDDAYIAANARLWDVFGRKSQYQSASEFDDLMLSDETFRL